MQLRRPTRPHISGKNGKGYFTVRRTTIRKRMRKKLQEIKQQLRQRMHDPVPQTGHGSGRLCKATFRLLQLLRSARKSR